MQTITSIGNVTVPSRGTVALGTGITLAVPAVEPELDCSALDGDLSRFTLRRAQHYSLVLEQQGRVATDADWNEQQYLHRYRTEVEAADVIGAAGAPLRGGNFRISLATGGADLQIAPGRIYVDGILCESTAPATYLHQPYALDPEQIDLKLGTYLVYIDVWRRHVTALDDPHIREVALNGPDTATREQIAWRVRALPVVLANLKDPSKITCGTELEEWDRAIAPSTGRLNARTRPPQPTDDACILPPTAGYQRLENQLYRVQIHDPGTLGVVGAKPPTFVWSRDNASVIAPVVAFSGKDVTLSTLGHDDDSGFASATMVELIDDRRVFDGLPGDLAAVASVDVGARKLTLDQNLAPIDPALHPRLRRWDGSGTAAVAPDDTSWLPLEAGIEVDFSAGTYANGDYWQIPARTATGEIEWPPYAPAGTPPSPQLRLGVLHHFCRLALVRPVGGKPEVFDCRPTFEPLTKSATHVLSTDWQNDDFIEPAKFFAQGLALEFDAPELTIADASIRVFADLPFTDIKTLGAAPATTVEEEKAPCIAVELPGTVSVDGVPPTVIPPDGAQSVPSSKLRWTPLAVVPRILDRYLPTGLRCRVVIKGETVFALDGAARAYLDGTATTFVGQRANSAIGCTVQSFPSGIGARASDFASWFFLQRAAPPLIVKRLEFQNVDHVLTLDVLNPLNRQTTAIPFARLTAQIAITFSAVPNAAGFGTTAPRAVRVTFQGRDLSNVTTSLTGPVAAVGGFRQPSGALGMEPGDYVLTVFGAGDGVKTVGVTGLDGGRFDGPGNGQPGRDFIFPFTIAR